MCEVAGPTGRVNVRHFCPVRLGNRSEVYPLARLDAMTVKLGEELAAVRGNHQIPLVSCSRTGHVTLLACLAGRRPARAGSLRGRPGWWTSTVTRQHDLSNDPWTGGRTRPQVRLSEGRRTVAGNDQNGSLRCPMIRTAR